MSPLPPTQHEIDAYVQSVFDKLDKKLEDKAEAEKPAEEYDDGRDFTPPYEP